jgi:hypothetical protein
MITKEILQSRLKQLIDEKKNLQETYEQLGRNLNAYDGAIEDCKFWLSELEKEEGVIPPLAIQKEQ